MARKKKTLLTEGEMRRFMKLANIAPIQEMGGMYPGARDEEEEMDMDDMGDMGDMGDEEMEMDEPDEAPDMEMDVPEPEMDMGDEEGADQMISIRDMVSAIEKALEDVTGEEVTTDIDMDAEDDEAPPEGGDEINVDTGVGMPEPGDDEEEDMDLMAERIARRVRRRMMKENNKKTSNKAKALKEARIRRKRIEERADRLTNKIFARIMKESR